MKRFFRALLVLFLFVFIVGGSLAGNHDCVTCGACDDADWTVNPRLSAMGKVAAYTITGAKWCACSSAHALGVCHHAVHSGMSYTRDAISATADWTGDAINKITTEVMSLSLRALRSAFSSFWALVSDLTRS